MPRLFKLNIIVFGMWVNWYQFPGYNFTITSNSSHYWLASIFKRIFLFWPIYNPPVLNSIRQCDSCGRYIDNLIGKTLYKQNHGHSTNQKHFLKCKYLNVKFHWNVCLIGNKSALVFTNNGLASNRRQTDIQINGNDQFNVAMMRHWSSISYETCRWGVNRGVSIVIASK